MFKDFRLGQYFQGESFLHKLDPRTKLIGYLILTIVIFVNASWWNLVGMVILLGYLVVVTKVPGRYYLSNIKALWLIILFSLLLNSVNQKGPALVSLGPVAVSINGIFFGVAVALKLIMVVILTSIFTFTTSPIALSDGLEKLMQPFAKFGLPAHEIALMMSIALRFIPTIMDEGDRLVKAIQARGGDIDSGGLFRRARSLIPLLIPLFIGSFRRAEELALAMEIRCYRGSSGRTRYRQSRLGRSDYAILTVAVAIALFVLGARLA